jgi:hypothetical protein
MIHVRGQVHPSVCQQVTCNLAPFSDCVLVTHLAAWYALILLLTGSLLTVESSNCRLRLDILQFKSARSRVTTASIVLPSSLHLIYTINTQTHSHDIDT